jgi:hypothetical protein
MDGAALPVAIGGGVAAMTTIGIRHYMKPETETQLNVVKQAPWIGIGAGTLVSLAMFNMASQPAGVAGMVAAALVGVTMLTSEAAAKARLDAAVAQTDMVGANGAAPVAGFGAVVPEYSSMRGLPARRGRGMGAIAMEPHASRGYGAGPLGAYGETVNLGNINASVFGTPGFQLGRR